MSQRNQDSKQVQEGDPCFKKACPGVLVEDDSTYTCSECNSKYGQRNL